MIALMLSFLYQNFNSLVPIDSLVHVDVADKTTSRSVHVVLGQRREQLKENNARRERGEGRDRGQLDSSHDSPSSSFAPQHSFSLQKQHTLKKLLKTMSTHQFDLCSSHNDYRVPSVLVLSSFFPRRWISPLGLLP